MKRGIIIEQTTSKELADLIRTTVKEVIESLAPNQSSVDPGQKLTRQQVKERYHLSFPTILKLEKEGVIKGYRIGRRVLYNKEEIENSLKERRF